MALEKADGTPITKTPGSTVIQTVSDADPLLQVQIDVYRETPYAGVGYPTQERQLAFRAGQQVRTSVWNAEFTAPTISTITPSSISHTAGGNTTIKGPGVDGSGKVIGGFSLDATVTVGGAAATSVVVVDPNTITCHVPTAASAGAADVVVTQSSGTVTKTGGITYT